MKIKWTFKVYIEDKFKIYSFISDKKNYFERQESYLKLFLLEISLRTFYLWLVYLEEENFLHEICNI